MTLKEMDPDGWNLLNDAAKYHIHHLERSVQLTDAQWGRLAPVLGVKPGETWDPEDRIAALKEKWEDAVSKLCKARDQREEARAQVKALSPKTCDHKYGAQFGCEECVRYVRSRLKEFPLQTDRDSKPGPTHVPWVVAERAWAEYARQYGRGQSVERLAERGGFSWGEMDLFYPRWRDDTDEWKKLKAENDSLGTTIAAYDEKFKLQRAAVDKAEAERDAALALAETIAGERNIAQLERTAAEKQAQAALAQVEGLREAIEMANHCPDCRTPHESNITMPALSSTPAPAVYTRERLERAWKAAYRGFRSSCTWTSTGNAFWGTLGEKAPPHPDEDDQNEALREEWLKPALDAHPDTEVKP